MKPFINKFFGLFVAILALILFSSCIIENKPGVLILSRINISLDTAKGRMWPYQARPLGVKSLSSRGFIEIQDTPGITFEWTVSQVVGHTFTSDEEAYGDFFFNDIKALDPVVSVRSPSRWPDGSFAVFTLNSEYKGSVNNTAKYLMEFNDGWSEFVRVVLVPDHGEQNHVNLTNLGVTGFYCQGSDVTHQTLGLSYNWNVVDVFGYEGFANYNQAIADIGFVNSTLLDPRLTLRNPTRWVVGSVAILELSINYKGITNCLGRFIVTFHDGWNGTYVETIDLGSCAMDPDRPGNFGIDGFQARYSSVNHLTPDLTYQWQVVNARGHLFSNDARAIADIRFEDNTVLSPTITVDTPGHWPNLSFVSFRVTITHRGIENYTGTFVVIFVSGFANTPVQIYDDDFNLHDFYYVVKDPYEPSTLGIKGFKCEDYGIDRETEGIGTYWRVTEAKGGAGVQDISIADPFEADPFITASTPDEWPAGSIVVLRCKLTYNGKANDTVTAIVEFQPKNGNGNGNGNGDGDGDNDGEWSDKLSVSIEPSSKVQDPWNTEAFEVLAKLPSGTAIDNNGGYSFNWAIIEVTGHSFSSRGLAVSDIVLNNSNTLNPTLSTRNPECWPLGSHVMFSLNITKNGITNSTGLFFVMFEPPSLSIKPDTKYMNPYVPAALDVTGFTGKGVEVSNNTPGITFEWRVADVGGALFADEKDALADIQLSNINILNPILTAKTPNKWPDDSGVHLLLVITSNGYEHLAGSFLVVFGDPLKLGTPVFQPDSKMMDPKKPETLGISSFYIPNTEVNNNTVGMTLVWKVVAAEGHNFGSLALALADIELDNDSILNPKLTVKHPDMWPNWSTVTLKSQITYKGITNENGLFTVTFVDPFLIVAVILQPEGKIMDPVVIEPLGVTAFGVSNGSNVTQNMAGVTYKWEAISASGYTKYSSQVAALADVFLNDTGILNPVLTIGTPANWPRNSTLTFKVSIGYNGMINEKARFTIKFDGKFSEGLITFSPTFKFQSPTNTEALGITAFSIAGSSVNQNTTGVKYSWSIKEVYGYTGFVNDAAAMADVKLNNVNTLNPTVSVTTSSSWPFNSGVRLKCVITYNNMTNDTGIFNIVWGDLSQLILTIEPSSKTQDPFVQNERLNPTSIKLSPIGEIWNSTGTYENSFGFPFYWTVDSVSGHSFYANGSITADEVALQNVWFIHSDGQSYRYSNEANPIVRVAYSGSWPTGSSVTLKLTIPQYEKSCLFTVYFDKFSYEEVIISPNSKDQIPTIAETLGVNAFSFTRNGLTNVSPGVSCSWIPFSASGYTGFASEADALADIKLSNANILNPVLSVTNPSRWPNESSVVLKLNIAYTGLTNSTGRFTVRFVDIGGQEIILETQPGLSGGQTIDSYDTPKQLGVTGFSIGSINNNTPGITFNWEVDSIGGTSAGMGDVVLHNNSNNVSPSISVNTPLSWPEGSYVILRLKVFYNGALNNEATYRVKFTYVPARLEIYGGDTSLVQIWSGHENGVLEYLFKDVKFDINDGLDIKFGNPGANSNYKVMFFGSFYRYHKDWDTVYKNGISITNPGDPRINVSMTMRVIAGPNDMKNAIWNQIFSPHFSIKMDANYIVYLAENNQNLTFMLDLKISINNLDTFINEVTYEFFTFNYQGNQPEIQKYINWLATQ
jgi:hypothetical protein